MARRSPRQEATHQMTLTPLQERCEECDQVLWVANHGHRTVTRLDGLCPRDAQRDYIAEQ